MQSETARGHGRFEETAFKTLSYVRKLHLQRIYFFVPKVSKYNTITCVYLKPCKIIPVSKRQIKKIATNTALAVRSMLITFLQDIMCVISGSWLQNYFNAIWTPNTFENRNVIRYNLST